MKSYDAGSQARDASPMKVLLIFPPPSDKYSRDYKNAIGSGIPLGVAHLGSALERGGFKVEAFDFQIPGNTDSRLREVLRGGFGMIGLSVFTLSAHSAYDIIGKAREASPGSTVVVGGPHPTALGPAVLDECDADVAAFGEGEITVVELARAVARSESFEAGKGIAFRRGGKIVTTAPQPPVEDLDTLPPPALHLFDIKKYAQPGAASLYFPSINMITSRGCPYDCSFCFKKLWGPRCRFMSVGRVMADIAELRAKHGAGEVAFFDDTFTLDRDRALSLCEKMLEEKKPLPWRCNSRVDRVDAELLTLMRRAGCYSIGYGIESGNAEVLKRCGKGITLEQVRNAVELARRAGIESRGYFIFNLHGDTRETMEETTRFALSLPLAMANFTMATALHRNAAQRNSRERSRLPGGLRPLERLVGVLRQRTALHSRRCGSGRTEENHLPRVHSLLSASVVHPARSQARQLPRTSEILHLRRRMDTIRDALLLLRQKESLSGKLFVACHVCLKARSCGADAMRSIVCRGKRGRRGMPGGME